MHKLLAVSGLTFLAAACTSAPVPPSDPPALVVTSPMRSLVQSAAGQIQVTGTVSPNPEGDPIKTVMVNDVAAIVGSDGSWSATISVPEGATLIHTVATDDNGGTAKDTRSVQAGTMTANGSNVKQALTAALSTQAFAKISAAAGPLIKQTDMAALLAPMQPMQHAGDEDGPDCLYDQLFVDNLTMSDAKFSLVPAAGGIAFSAEIDGLDIPAHVNYAVACYSDSNTVEVTASKVVVSGTLRVAPDGKGAFTTTLDSPDVEITGMNLSASGLPGDILNMIDINGLLTYVVEQGAEQFMGPMMNDALGALGGPKTLNVLGQTITMQVVPSDVELTPAGGTITLDTQVLVAGTANARGFVFTDNSKPVFAAGSGFQMAIADDLANEMVSEFTALGVLDLTMPSAGGSFDSVALTTNNPPMISASGTDGKLHMVLGDMTMTFLLAGKPVGTAALNAMVDVKINPAGNTLAVGVELDNPVIDIDVDDATNQTRFADDDLSALVSAVVGAQIDSVGKLLSVIPIPAFAGLQLQNVSVGGTDGYVMLTGMFE